ncbi:META domain-containing protein [Prevotella sp. 10(H)]|uniref:META domain-containing protein n=1 Tax=Prevotella sp. 10(H) TaxID=1158294 RepID=UPI0004A7145E|nr:META domain-containing protein [Prevotella sp. 10(H)]
MKRIFNSAILAIATLALTFGLQSCNSVKPVDKTQLGGYWSLKTLKGEEAKTAFAGNLPYVQFDFEKNIVSGNGGCNTFSGPFTLSERNEFSAPNLAATMKMCMQGNKEPQFFSALSSPNLTLSLDKDGMLTLSEGNSVVLQFEKGEAPTETANTDMINAESLTGAWTLTSISGGDMKTLFTGKTPTMEFSADGKVFGNAGCNTYRTGYTLADNTITFLPVASTKMACPSMKGEDMFTGLLASPLQAGLNGDKLIFTKDGNVVLEFTKGAEK